MKATDVSPLFTRDGVYCLKIHQASDVIVVTLLAVVRDELYGVSFLPIDDPDADGLAALIRTETASLMRMVEDKPG